MYARHALCPRGDPYILALTDASYCLLHGGPHRLPLLHPNEAESLHAYALRSHTPLPTLKPHLTIMVPRLSIDCWLNFVETCFSPLYISSAELAHPPLVFGGHWSFISSSSFFEARIKPLEPDNFQPDTLLNLCQTLKRCVIVCSTLIGFVTKGNKPSKKQILATAIAVASTVVLIL